MTRLGTRAAIAAAIAVAVAGCGGSDKQATQTTQAAPKRATPVSAQPADLRKLATKLGHDIFWAGPKRGYTYELTRTGSGDVYLRYLPPGVPIGAAGADFLSIGTYPQRDAFATVQQAQKRPGETVIKLPGQGIAVIGAQRPQSVYFAYPGATLLIEVYDPSPARARKLVTSRTVVPVH
jgi:hypothetical protein